ncbi:hypothetical protein LIL_10412 [Leptospira interrogans serovar Linhai str. 56609]|uniref:Uncharacterized protein n=1 Tax=Leptospira interrogans serovar Hardjo str. Norma TaxID=1279460 RepID=A0A0M4N611_LEPIR|nr:hypothetical protein LIL_10412 [Leptospira interrogans serovar Linhai str. 56609]ALE37706.1 hypothetical protein G436_0483 [Leptospira interrogans serovar Hardjo str. Norma]
MISISKMWELPQITILRTNSKIVGAHTFRKFFLIYLHRTHVK